MESSSLLNQIKESIRTTDPTAEAYLFGSRARSTHREDSDWDVLILVDVPVVSYDVEDKFRDALYDLELASGEIISIFIYPKDYWRESLKFSPLYSHINRDGLKLQ